jgi:restriction system protein
MAIPDYQTLMEPVLRAAANGEVRISDVINQIADKFGLAQVERTELLPSGRQTILANRVHWAKTYLKQAGLLASKKDAISILPREAATLCVRAQKSIIGTFLNFRIF